MEKSSTPPDPRSVDRFAPASPRTGQGRERLWLALLTLAALGLLLALSAGLLWVQRDSALGLAKAQSQREVRRLAAELEQSLRQARALMAVPAPTARQGSAEALVSGPLVQTLKLPFELLRLPPDASTPTALVPGQWRAGRVREAQGRWYLPLYWQQGPDQGGQRFELRLPRDTLIARFASEGLPDKGSMSLFLLTDDGATTVLVRYPVVEREQGLTVKGHVATAVARAPAGLLQVRSAIDGVPRIVGYQQLGDGAQRLVLVYALPVAQVLAVWRATLPLAVALTLLLAMAMAYGAWRLDRSLRALRRSERHHQTLTEHLPDVVVRYDREGRVRYANPALALATGHQPGQLIGRTHRELGEPETMVQAWSDCLERVFSTGRKEILYFTYPSPQGTRHWEAMAMLEPAPAGEAACVLVVSRDITERQQAQAERLSAQRLFETVFQAAPEAMSLSDWASGRLLLVNDAFCTLFDRPRDSLIGQSATALGLWQSPDLRQELIGRLQRGEAVRDARASSLRPDGQLIEVLYSAERVQEDAQDRLLLMFRDVTRFEHDRRALARSSLRFRLAAQRGQVWEWDLEQALTPPGDVFFAALGYPAAAATEAPRPLHELVHPDDRVEWQQVFLRFLKGHGDFAMELRARHVLGHYRWFELRGSGQRDAGGRVTYMAGTVFDITDRKALEEAQRQTLKHLDTVTNASAALLWTVDAEGRTDWYNQAWRDFTGREPQGEHTQTWLADLMPSDRDTCARVFGQAFDAREPCGMEYRMRRHDGVHRWLLEQGRPRFDADGCFIGFIRSCLDVTEQRQAEATASQRAAMLEQVFGVLRDMLFVVDAQHQFVFFQAGSEDRLYRRPEDFLGRSITEVLPPALAAQLGHAMAQARTAGLQEIDYSLDLPGATHHFNARLAWLPGNEQCMFLVRDTTEQQNNRAERERLSGFVLLLFRLASRFINLPLQQMDEAIDAALGDMGIFVNADRAYLFAYDTAAGTASNTHEWCAAGISPQKQHWQQVPIGTLADWHQMHLRGEQVQVPDAKALPPCALRDMLEAMNIRGLLTLPLMDGSRCLGFVGLDAVHQARAYGSEEITLLDLFAQMLVNLQLRARAAAQVREITEQLEDKVEERTQQLFESVQRLQSVNSELESFTYSASHDLRTPLRGIEGFSALLLEEHAGQLDAQGRGYLQRIQRATLHMSQLVNDLLTYSRLQALSDQVGPVALADLVTSVVRPFQDELAARQGRLSVQMPDGLQVLADPQGLAIVLRNLIDNALKFTASNQAPEIQVQAHIQGDRVLLSVSDQGMGFDMKHHDRIFGMFQRLHRQDQIPGTGIGLALVHKAVVRMGGRISAESAPGRGARFQVDLALARGA